MKMIMADSLDSQVTRQWYLGNININFRKQFTEELTDSFCRRYLNIRYHGKKMPIRAGVVLRDLNLRPRQLYRVENEEKARQHLQSMGVFNYTSLQFTPRDTTVQCDTLDATLDLIFDKPYDFYIETNVKGKTTGRVGPELVVGLPSAMPSVEARSSISICMALTSGRQARRATDPAPTISIPMSMVRMCHSRSQASSPRSIYLRPWHSVSAVSAKVISRVHSMVFLPPQ